MITFLCKWYLARKGIYRTPLPLPSLQVSGNVIVRDIGNNVYEVISPRPLHISALLGSTVITYEPKSEDPDAINEKVS